MSEADELSTPTLAEHGDWVWRMAASMGMDDEDGRQTARLGFVIATRTWDPARGPFRYWAFHAVRRELQDARAHRPLVRFQVEVGRYSHRAPTVVACTFDEVQASAPDLEAAGQIRWFIDRLDDMDPRLAVILFRHTLDGATLAALGGLFGIGHARAGQLKDRALGVGQADKRTTRVKKLS